MMNKVTLLIPLLFYFQNVVGQSQFLKEMQTHTNIFEQGIANKIDQADSIQHSSADYNELMENARVLMADGHYQKSIELLKYAKNIYLSSIDQSVGSFKSITQRNPYPDYYIGLNFMFLEEVDSAQYYYKKAISEAPFFPDVYNEVGNLFLRQQLLDSAQIYFEKGLSLDNKSAILNHNMGLVYFIRGERNQAKKYFLNNIGVNPEFAPSYILAASIYEENESFHMAELFYSKAITLNEEKFDFLIARGYYYLRNAELYRAYVDFKSAESLGSLGNNELWQLALLELNNNQYLTGMDYVDKMNNLGPTMEKNVQYNTSDYLDIEIASLLLLYTEKEAEVYEKEILGRLLSEVFFNKNNGTYSKAIELLKLYPNSEIVNRASIYAKARLYINRDDVSYQLVNNFLSRIDDVLNKFERPELYLLKARILEKYGIYDEALIEIESIINLKKSYVIAYLYQGSINYQLEQFDLAIESFNKALELEPSFMRALNARAMVYLNQKKFNRAIKDFRSVIDTGNYNGWPLNGLAMCYRSTGQVDSALVYFNKALEVDPDMIACLINRGDLFFEVNQLERALLDYNRIIEMSPNNRLAREKRGDILLKMSQFRSAVDDYLSVLNFYQQEKFKLAYREDAYLIVRKYLSANEQLIEMFTFVNDKTSADFCKKNENEILLEYSESYANFGAVAFHRGEYAESKKRLEIALEFDPDNYKAQHYLAIATLYLGDVDEAYRLYKKFKNKANRESVSDAIFILSKVDSSDPRKEQVQSILSNILSN